MNSLADRRRPTLGNVGLSENTTLVVGA